MINWNDPFTGLMLFIGILIVFFGYLAFFAEVEDERKGKSRSL